LQYGGDGVGVVLIGLGDDPPAAREGEPAGWGGSELAVTWAAAGALLDDGGAVAEVGADGHAVLAPSPPKERPLPGAVEGFLGA
jgi:hypothetical protein